MVGKNKGQHGSAWDHVYLDVHCSIKGSAPMKRPNIYLALLKSLITHINHTQRMETLEHRSLTSLTRHFYIYLHICMGEEKSSQQETMYHTEHYFSSGLSTH